MCLRACVDLLFARFLILKFANNIRFAPDFTFKLLFMEPTDATLVPARVHSQEYSPALFAAPPSPRDGSVCFREEKNGASRAVS